MANQDLIIKTRKYPSPFNGPNSSGDLKAFIDQVVQDLQNLADKTNALQSRLDYLNTIRFDEVMKSIETQALDPRHRIAYDSFKAQAGWASGNEIDYYIDFAYDENISFQGANERHAFLYKKLGEVRPPRNNVISFFYQRDSINGLRAISRNPVVTITSEPSDPDLKIEYNSPVNMANGSNEFYWYRKYSFPAYSDVSEVTLEFTIDVPIISGIEPNYLVVDPLPIGDLTLNSIDSDGGPIVSTPVANAPAMGWETPAGITQLTFNITQENFTIENGRKVFLVGFKEIDAQFVEWDETPTSVSKDPLTDNHIEVNLEMVEEITDITDIKVTGDFSHLKIVGYQNDVADPNVISLSRLAFNDGNNVAIGHTFAGAVDRLVATLFLNADPLEDGDRISGTVDHAEIIFIRAE